MVEQRSHYFEEDQDFSDANTGRLSSDFILSFDEVTRGGKD